MAELGHALDRMGVKVSGAELRSLMSDLDIDKSGTVSVDEFVRFGVELFGAAAPADRLPTDEVLFRSLPRAWDKGLAQRAAAARTKASEVVRASATARRAVWTSREAFAREALEAFCQQETANEEQLKATKEKAQTTSKLRMKLREDRLQEQWRLMEEVEEVQKRRWRERLKQEQDIVRKADDAAAVRFKPLLPRQIPELPFLSRPATTAALGSLSTGDGNLDETCRLSSPGYPKLRSDDRYLERLSEAALAYLPRARSHLGIGSRPLPMAGSPSPSRKASCDV